MATGFDPELTEFHLHTGHGDEIDLYKVGGGTLGHTYDGLWGYRLTRRGKLVGDGETLRTGTPKTHQEAALLVLDFFSIQE